MMRQSPKPCNRVQDEANPISSPVMESMRTDAASVQCEGAPLPNFGYGFRRFLVVRGVG
jgi:hypothetical protein